MTNYKIEKLQKRQIIEISKIHQSMEFTRKRGKIRKLAEIGVIIYDN